MRRHRPVLRLAAALGVAGGLGGRLAGLSPSQALLAGWCAAAAAWLVLVLTAMLRASIEDIRGQAAALDGGRWSVLSATLGAALASLGAVVWDLAAPGPPSAGTVALGLGTILLSWLFLQVLFAVHYAQEHWRDGRGIDFPGCDGPDFPEFLYFAFTVGMTFQVSDATTRTPAIRRLVLLHAAVAFLFNAVILAAAVNLAAGLAG